MIIDSGSSEVTVTSELCTNCNSKKYRPGLSHTTFNTGEYYELDYNYDQIMLKVIEFKDDVCVLGNCNPKFTFFTIFEQKNLPVGADGIFGVGTKAASGPSFLIEMAE